VPKPGVRERLTKKKVTITFSVACQSLTPMPSMVICTIKMILDLRPP
jgi:hypothetical protein